MWQQRQRIDTKGSMAESTASTAAIEGTAKTAGSAVSTAADQSIPDDVLNALQLLTQQITNQQAQAAPYFDINKPLMAGRAPARLDVMGGIADYSGSTVLQLPLRESAVVFCQLTTEPSVRIVSGGCDYPQDLRSFHAPLQDFFAAGTSMPCSNSHMREYFAAKPEDQRWAAYFAGVLTVLMNEYNVRLEQGISIYGHSTVPEGKGVSSSAAIEVAAMRSITLALELDIDAHQQAVLCQRVENLIVGAPCGLMDQMTSSMGCQGSLLNMLCQPDKVREPVKLPDHLSVWGIDSGLRHAVSGADYGAVRVGAFMGYRILLEVAGIASTRIRSADIVDTRWNGYLANVSISDFSENFARHLPLSLSGQQFLERFDGTTDTVTRIDPTMNYSVFACTAHPVHEHHRVSQFAQLSRQSPKERIPNEAARLMGECMYLSHASYSECGLGSAGTDELVARLRQIGTDGGVYGARITGGGNGGTVAILAEAGADDVVRAVAADYAQTSGIGGQVFSGSSNGASAHILDPAIG